MPTAYGMVAGIKHPPNEAPSASEVIAVTDEGIAAAVVGCPSCGADVPADTLRNGMCRECAYERGIPVHAARMRRRMRLAGITVASVAHALHVNSNTMRNYVSGRTSPPLTVFAGMCREIGMTPNEVLGFGRKRGSR